MVEYIKSIYKTLRKEGFMSKTEAIENMVKIILGGESRMLSTDEYNELIEKAETKTEENLYTVIYNYLLAEKQTEVVSNAKF